jgi:hypothetical protein
MTSSENLRLSAVRAFLGRIHPEMRLIKAKFCGDEIVLTVVFDNKPSEAVQTDVSEAAAEIIADFPDANLITEHLEITVGPISNQENILDEGWIYQRAEIK